MPHDDRQAAIHAAALREFADNGFAGTSVAAVAARAGISKALVYQHFSSKEQLFFSCFLGVAEPLLAEIDKAMTSGAPPFLVPLHAIRATFEGLGPDRTVWRIFHDSTAPVVGAAGEVVVACRQRLADFVTSGVTDFLGAHGDTDEGDIDALARAWTAIVDAIVAWAVDHPDETTDQLTERFARIINAIFSIGAQ